LNQDYSGFQAGAWKPECKVPPLSWKFQSGF